MGEKIDGRLTAMDEMFNTHLTAMGEKIDGRLTAMNEMFNTRLTAMNETIQYRFLATDERISASESKVEARIMGAANRLMIAMIIIAGSIIASLLYAG